jgi:ApaG protein
MTETYLFSVHVETAYLADQSSEEGEHFTYTSGTALNTAVGQMRGRYHIVAVDGTSFEAEIPPFILATPRVLH